MVRAIIFDCFGVLAEDGWTPFKLRYLADPDKREEVARVGKAVDYGQLEYEDMITETARIAGISEQVVREAVGTKVPNLELFAFIKEKLKPAYKIGMLSNASYDVAHELFTSEQMSVFDATALSYELGLTKPDPAMFQAIANRLEVPAEHCLMVDDRERHVDGAKDAGMQAILYTSVRELGRQLADLGITLK